MPASFPALRVDHVSIAVRAIAPALAFFRRLLPIRMRVEPRPGYDDQFVWTDFFVGDWKLELIESARPASFVERFLARRGEGMHHLSIDVEESRLGAYAAALEGSGLRIVDRGDYGNGDETAFISPRTAPGILVQFCQVPGFHGAPPADHPTDPVATRDGVRFRVDHLALAVRSIEATFAWFTRIFPVEAAGSKQLGWDGAYNFQSFRLAGYKMELIESARPASFVERFLARRGEGVHHLAIDVGRVGGLVRRLGGERGWWSAVVRRAFGPAAERPSFDRCFAELFAHYGRPEAWRVFPEVPEALRLLRAHGLTLAVVSNFDGRLPRVLASLGLRPLVDLVVHSTAAAAAKPDPAIFRAALSALGVAPPAALHAGDGLVTDVEGARRAGLRAVLVDRGEHRPRLPAGVPRIAALSEIATLTVTLP